MAVNIVEDTVSVYGLRVMHGLSFQTPIAVDEMKALVPQDCKELASFYTVVERELGMFHMYAAWNVREMVDFSKVLSANSKTKGIAAAQPTRLAMTNIIRYGVLWYINLKAGETMSLAIELAAEEYKRQTGNYPTAVWMRKRPATAPEVYTMVNEVPTHELHLSLRSGAQRSRRSFAGSPRQLLLPLLETDWVPEKFIVVGIPKEQWNPEWKDGKFVEAVSRLPAEQEMPVEQERLI